MCRVTQIPLFIHPSRLQHPRRSGSDLLDSFNDPARTGSPREDFAFDITALPDTIRTQKQTDSIASNQPPIADSSPPDTHSSASIYDVSIHDIAIHSAPIYSAPIHSAPIHSAPIHSASLSSKSAAVQRLVRTLKADRASVLELEP